MTGASDRGRDPGGWAPYLGEGERLLWEGRPDDRLFLLRREDIVLVPVSLILGGLAFTWTIAGVAMIGSFGFFLAQLAFSALSIHLIVGRFFFDAATRRRTRYAVTDRRALIVRGGWRRIVREMALWPGLEVEVRHGTPGSIRLGPPPPILVLNRWGKWNGDDDGSFEFRGVSNVPKVHAALRSVLNGYR